MRRTLSRASTTLAALVSALITLSSCGSAPITQPIDPATSFRFPLIAADEASRPPAPPLRLTASDGTGLELVQLTGRAVIEEPLAFTEIRLVFENPEDRIIEGNFSVTLPEGASVSRFAMKLDDAWQEGEVVEKKQAREAYEDFLHRRQDPALLEQAAGNEFNARVFPIPAHGTKELILSYSQEIPGGATYILPLRGLPRVRSMDLSVSLAGAPSPLAELRRENFTPPGDFTIDPRALKGGAGLRNGNLVLTRVHPIAESHPDPIDSAIVLVDTSASRSLGFEEEVRLVGQLAQMLGKGGGKVPLIVGCYDQGTELIFAGDASAFGEQEARRIRERQAFGASNLAQALGWAERQAKTRGARRVILITDGVATAGETAADQLRAVSARLAPAGVERIDAIAVGGIRDEALLKHVVTAGLPRDGVVVDGASDPSALRRRLTEATRSGIPVKIEGASFVYPSVIDGAQAGDEVLVYADVPPEQTVRISVGGGAFTSPELSHAERPLLERSFAQAKIASLLALSAKKGQDTEIQREIVALSVAHRVVSPYTSLLVLETERDYARFNIDRRALADILTVEGSKVAMQKRIFGAGGSVPLKSNDIPMPPPAPIADRRGGNARPQGPPPADAAEPPPPPPAPPAARASAAPDPMSARGNMWGSEIGDSFGAGGLGLTGIGEGGGGRSEGIGLGSIGTIGHGAGAGQGQGFGSGHGRLSGFSATSAPTVRMGATQVSGRIPPEVIQRIVRQNFGRFRRCYEDGLRTNPQLQGRVSVRFIIDLTGTATKPVNGGSDLPDQNVIACVVRSFEGLGFPQPEGGIVTVTYPIMFSPSDSSSAPSAVTAPSPAAPPPPPPAPPPEQPALAKPYTGRFKAVMESIAQGTAREAIHNAFAWHKEAPGDVMALVSLGEAFEAAGEIDAAARAYGSIIDLFSSRADMRRFAGERLEHLRGGAGLDLAIDTFEKAEEARPDHPASHRLLAFARLRRGEYDKAFDAAEAGAKRRYPSGRFAGVDRILREDLGLIAAAWIKKEPARADEIKARLREDGGTLEDAASLRFVLNWETDANDVDFHIFDDVGGHAYYHQKSLPSGGELYADVTTGYGPECFTIRGPKESRAKQYTLQAHYYARGPMGYGMGKLEIIDHDGQGGLTFDERTFVVMVDHAFVDLGSVHRL